MNLQSCLSFSVALLFLTTQSHALPSCDSIFTAQEGEQTPAVTAHAAIASDLYQGRVISMRPFKENDNRNLLFLVKLEARDPYTGQLRYRDAFFKPSIWGDSGGYARAGMEYVAYSLNRDLKMDYIPPTAYRRRLSLHANGMHFQQGAIIFKVPEFTPMADLPHEKFGGAEGDLHDAIESDHRILSVMLQNGDGHHCNLGQGRHWTDGSIHPAFIDWGASLRQGTNVTLTHYPVFGNSRPVTRVRAQTLEALKNFGESHTRKWVNGRFISEDEARMILKIKDGIVTYFEELIKTRGAAQVLINF